jgi:hypothetical protein
VLDFKHVETSWGYCILTREGEELHLSTHAGDGQTGGRVVISVTGIDSLFTKFIARGLDTSLKPQSPVHQSPIDQTWGTREFYVDDPDGNTLRFVQR